MKRTFILAAASMLLAGFSVFADQQILIDFTTPSRSLEGVFVWSGH